MYYEEKILEGVLHYRMNPYGCFVPYTIRELTTRYLELLHELVPKEKAA